LISKKKILIIDDEQGFCEILQLNLEATQLFDVAIETDPCHAGHAALRFQPDLILLDVIMANQGRAGCC
jgi:two-component system alkaline phosphatase synthesis response regulator PhoP